MMMMGAGVAVGGKAVYRGVQSGRGAHVTEVVDDRHVAKADQNSARLSGEIFGRCSSRVEIRRIGMARRT